MHILTKTGTSPCSVSGKELPANAAAARDAGSISWRRKWQPIPVFLPRESHGQRSLVGHRKTWVPSLGREDLLEKEMATHSSTLAWKIPWTEEPSGPQSTGSAGDYTTNNSA